MGISIRKINRILTLGIAMIAVANLSAIGQSSMNIALLSTWTDNNIPLSSASTRYNDVWGYAANGREYALLGATDGMHIIDVTIPSAPVRIGFHGGGSNNSLWRDLEVYGSHVYAVSDQGAGSSLQIFDLSNLPASSTKVYDSQTILSRCHTITIDAPSGRLYASGSTASTNGVVILDIATNPANPTLLANFVLGGYVHDCSVIRDTLYAYFGGGMAVGGFDFADLNNPSALGMIYSYPEQGFAHSGVATAGMDYLYFCTELHNTGVHIMDIRDPFNINHLSTFRSALMAPTFTNSVGHNPFIRDSILYVAYYQDGLQMWDIRNPTAPVRIAYYDSHPQNIDYSGFHGAWSVYPFLPSGNILVTDTDNGLLVLRHTNALPVTLSNFTATKYEDQVTLSWRTQSEQNNSGFEVERSLDGIGFEKIGWVDGMGNSSEVVDYTFPDSDPVHARTYYRLRQVDFNGQTSPSNVVEVQADQNLAIVSLYPSPAAIGENVQVGLSTLVPQNVGVCITNLLGQALWSSHMELGMGMHVIEAPTKDLSAGNYILKVTGKDHVATQRFVVAGHP